MYGRYCARDFVKTDWMFCMCTACLCWMSFFPAGPLTFLFHLIFHTTAEHYLRFSCIHLQTFCFQPWFPFYCKPLNWGSGLQSVPSSDSYDYGSALGFCPLCVSKPFIWCRVSTFGTITNLVDKTPQGNKISIDVCCCKEWKNKTTVGLCGQHWWLDGMVSWCVSPTACLLDVQHHVETANVVAVL